VAVPVPVPANVEVMDVAAGRFHSLALDSDGTVWSWGHNERGQLGDGTTNDSPTPVPVSALTGVTATAVAGGAFFSFAITTP